MASRSISTSTERDDDEVVVGVVRAPHGLRGEVRIEPLTDRSEVRFRAGSRLLSAIGEVVVASVRGTADEPIVRFEGIEDRAAAQKLRGELRVPRREARGGGGWLWGDLIAMQVVTPDGVELGSVREVIRAGGADVLVVVALDGREILLPAIESVIREVDGGSRRIVAIPQEEA